MVFYIVKRLLAICAILVVISLIVFSITQVLPGDVAHIIAGQFASDEAIAAIREDLGLNAPLWQQYWSWASGILSGDLGDSLVMKSPVAPVLFHALANSAVLAAIAFVLLTILGISFGVYAALHENKPSDHAVSMFGYIGISAPEFFWGIVLILVFARYLEWFPASGNGDISKGIWDWVSHLILPAITLTLVLLAHVSRLTRSSMLETLRSQYVRNARAKGLPEKIVIRRHALRNALVPTITVLAMDVGWLIGGIVVVEVVFGYSGIGRLLVYAIQRQDLPLIQASVLIIAAIYCIANLIADLLYAYFNPKIRYG